MPLGITVGGVVFFNEHFAPHELIGGGLILAGTIFAIESLLNGLDESHAWKFHLLSLLMHAGVSALVAEVARRLTQSAPESPSPAEVDPKTTDRSLTDDISRQSTSHAQARK